MNFVRETVSDAAIGVGVSQTPDGLSAIHHPGCAAAIWNRQPAPGFQAWINALAPDQLPKARVILRPDAVETAVENLCEIANTSRSQARAWFVADVANLASQFAELMSAHWLRLRLDVVTGNACRKFHIDAVTARLVCTYRGTGTQYGLSPDGEEPRRVFTVPTTAPILLRGTLWPEQPKSGLLHRSPPIEGSGETRLLLVLDPVEDPADGSKQPIMH